MWLKREPRPPGMPVAAPALELLKKKNPEKGGIRQNKLREGKIEKGTNRVNDTDDSELKDKSDVEVETNPNVASQWTPGKGRYGRRRPGACPYMEHLAGATVWVYKLKIGMLQGMFSVLDFWSSYWHRRILLRANFALHSLSPRGKDEMGSWFQGFCIFVWAAKKPINADPKL